MLLLPSAAPLLLYQAVRKRGRNQLPKMQTATRVAQQNHPAFFYQFCSVFTQSYLAPTGKLY